MIICASNNFAVTRAPKTGGTSLEVYILESGLVDSANDTYTLEGGFANWEEFKIYSEAHNNLRYSELPRDLYGYDYLKDAQKTYAEVVELGQAPPDMPWIGTIRHPLHWLASLFYYANVRRNINAEENYKKYGHFQPEDKLKSKKMKLPNDSFDFLFDEIWNEPEIADGNLRPQTAYYPDHAQLFNIENLYEHASEFIKSKGGVVLDEVHVRESSNDPTYYLENLSEDRKQRALDIYEKDLIAWENSYAKFN